MVSRVRVEMGLCDRIHIISATERSGSFRIEIDTQCEEVENYVNSLGDLSVTDITDLSNSKVTDPSRANLKCPGCLVPAGVINAASMEAGMISRNLARTRGVSVMKLMPEER